MPHMQRDRHYDGKDRTSLGGTCQAITSSQPSVAAPLLLQRGPAEELGCTVLWASSDSDAAVGERTPAASKPRGFATRAAGAFGESSDAEELLWPPEISAVDMVSAEMACSGCTALPSR
jgi:hypothetical protein